CSSRRRHTRSKRDWSSDVCSSDLAHLLSLFEFDPEVPQIRFHANGLLLAAGPANPKSDRRFRASEHLSCPILGPITGPGLDTPGGACAAAREIGRAHV